MGSAAARETGIGAFGGLLLAGLTGGSSLALTGGALLGGLSGYSSGKQKDDAKASAHAMDEAQTKSDAQARDLKEKMLLQPKKTASDDSLANKNKQLQNMRLGIASTMTGASQSAAPTLSAPILSGKSKLGA